MEKNKEGSKEPKGKDKVIDVNAPVVVASQEGNARYSYSAEIPALPNSSVLVKVNVKGHDDVTIDKTMYSESYARLLAAERLLIENDKSDVSTIMDKWKPNSEGIINTLSSNDIPRVVTIEGTCTVNRLLMNFVETLAHEGVTLPFGDLGNLNTSAMHKVNSYLSMIAMRRQDIPTLDYTEIVTASAAGQPRNEAEITSSIQELTRLSKGAIDRYMMNNVIMPLLRDVLTKDTGVKNLSGVPVLETAQTYAGWRRHAGQQILRQPLISEITNYANSTEWLGNYSSLKNILISGVEQTAWVGVPLLLAAINDPWFQDNRAVLTVPDAKGSVVSLNPVYGLKRQAKLKSMKGNPLWVRDDFSATLPENISKEDIAWTILQLAKLNNVPIASSINLAFMSRYPNWSGLLINHEECEASSEWKEFITNILTMEYIRVSTKLPNVDQSIVAMFDEPNRSDLHASLSDKMYFVSLCHKVATDIMKRILATVSKSLEFDDVEFWQGLEEAFGEGMSSEDISIPGFTHLRQYDVKNPLFMSANGSVESSHYFFEQDVDYKHPVTDHFRDLLKRTNSLGTMNTELVSVRKFITSDAGYFDVPKMVDVDDFTAVTSVAINVESLDSIGEDHVLFKHKDKFTPMTKRPNAMTRGSIVVGKADCVILTYYHLPKFDQLMYAQSDMELTGYDFSRIFNIHLKEKGFRVVLPQTLMEIKPGSSFTYDPKMLMVIPKNNTEFSDLVSKWEHKMTGVVEEDIPDPEDNGEV